jgi:trehalose/maltose hydrolase-like predicted phosphorylase
MAKMHLAAIEWTIKPENWSGNVEVTSGLDGRVTNWGVARYRELEGVHLAPVSTGTMEGGGISLVVQTRQSRIFVAQTARARIFRDQEEVAVGRGLHQEDGYVHQTLSFEVAEGVPTRVEKLVAFYTSHDSAISDPLVAAETAVGRIESFASLFHDHAMAWFAHWESCDIRLPKSDRVQLILRLHTSHVLQTCSPHTVDLDAGVPARGLNGEAYRGHIFWDELYIYPFLDFRLPEITRSLLMYRYRRLDEARAAAEEHGYKGAMYPWQSGSDGTEETQVVHLNPKSGSWDPDFSHNQRHVNASIFYNIWRYFEASGDAEFLEDYGAEMLLEIARFWASIAHFNADRGRYEIHGVMGPDEYHERLHGSDEHGLRNNAYTNIMVAWISETACTALDRLPAVQRDALRRKIGLDDAEIETWKDMSARMYVPFHGDGIISQFEGFDGLEEFDWEGYRKKYGNIQRLDRILKAEGDSPDRFKLAKQADTLMLWYLFSDEDVRRLFNRLGYPYDADTARKNIDYYYPRTSHGSTLSLIVHADIEAGFDPDASWDMFIAALESDVDDIQGGTTKEGIHMGVMAGTLDLLQRGYLGTEIRDDVLYFQPRLTDRLDGLSFHMRFRGTPMRVSLESGVLTVTPEAGGAGSLKVGVDGTVHEIKVGESHAFTV